MESGPPSHYLASVHSTVPSQSSGTGSRAVVWPTNKTVKFSDSQSSVHCASAIAIATAILLWMILVLVLVFVTGTQLYCLTCTLLPNVQTIAHIICKMPYKSNSNSFTTSFLSTTIHFYFSRQWWRRTRRRGGRWVCAATTLWCAGPSRRAP